MVKPGEFDVGFDKVRTYSAVLLAGLGLAACGIGSRGASASQDEIQRNPQLVFDDLRPGRHFVKVYPGYGNSRKAKQYNGDFLSGDSVDAVCRALGRTVESTPRIGERRRKSREWFRILSGGTGKTYASAVYVKNLRQLRSHDLKDC